MFCSFIRIGIQTTCTKFRENRTETVGGGSIRKKFDGIHTDRCRSLIPRKKQSQLLFSMALSNRS